MDLVRTDIQAYAERHTSPESDLLRTINRETYERVMAPRMLSGHLQGRFLAMISCIVQPKWILEIGTYTGYSAICLAEGLQPGGKLITLDVNEELEDTVRENFEKAALTAQVDFRIGNAVDIIPQLNEQFDMVFIDADKENYSRYFDLVIDHVNLNGVILADNVLWSGKVLGEKPDKDTKAIMAFNQKVAEDNRVQRVLLPIRDGIMMMRKVKQ